jgi:hypothetical protein
MNEPVTITVFFDIARTSPNRRLVPALQRQEARMARETARIAWMQAGSPKLPPPVLANIVVRRGRKMDDDNCMAACKWVRDGIFKDGLVKDDGPAFVRYGTLTQITGKPDIWDSRPLVPSVTFEVTSIAEEEA